jgi:uncharacterized protein (DUF58 family)
MHKSRVKGPGLEFSQYRSYQAGDDLRWLDWKMYARSDRYYIRESEIETSISVRFLIDASGSMNHQDSDFTKIEYARWICASLAYLANLQGDSVGLYIFQDGELFQMPSRKDIQHLARFYYQLEHIEPAGKFSDPIQYKNIFAGSQKENSLFSSLIFMKRRARYQNCSMFWLRWGMRSSCFISLAETKWNSISVNTVPSKTLSPAGCQH